MNDTPGLFIEFNPETWQITAVYYRTSTDEETKRLTEILTRGVKCEMLTPAGDRYDA